MAHISVIDDLKTWFLGQGDRTQWKLWASDRVPPREENSTHLIMFQKDAALSASESFDILATTLKAFQKEGGYFTVRVFKVENDPRGPAITIKLEPQSHQQAVQIAPVGIGSAPVSEKMYERIFEMKDAFASERTDLKLDLIRKDNEIARLKDNIANEKKRQDAGIGNAIVKSGQLPELIGAVMQVMKGQQPSAAVGNAPKRGLFKADDEAEYKDQDCDIIEIAAPSCDRFMSQSTSLAEQFGIQSNDTLDIVYAIAQIAEKQGVEARLLFGTLYDKVKENPSLIKMIV